jgi:hypothetical protein
VVDTIVSAGDSQIVTGETGIKIGLPILLFEQPFFVPHRGIYYVVLIH